MGFLHERKELFFLSTGIVNFVLYTFRYGYKKKKRGKLLKSERLILS